MRLVFDLDGTLIDSLVDLTDSANQMVQSFGSLPLSVVEVSEMVGDGAQELVRRALAAAELQVDVELGLSRFLEIYERRMLYFTEPYRGIREALPQLAERHALAVLTNKPTGLSNKILEGLGLNGFFDRVIGGDGPYRRKPDPDGLHALMGDVPASATALFGDSPVDEETARLVGCRFVYARYGYGSRRYGGTLPDTPFILQRPSELLDIVERLQTSI